MDIVVNEELKAYIDPLTPEEDEALGSHLAPLRAAPRSSGRCPP